MSWRSTPSLSTRGCSKRKLSLSSQYNCQTGPRNRKTSDRPSSNQRMPAHRKTSRSRSRWHLPLSSPGVACSSMANMDALTTRLVLFTSDTFPTLSPPCSQQPNIPCHPLLLLYVFCAGYNWLCFGLTFFFWFAAVSCMQC